jgi:hypothetical protein
MEEIDEETIGGGGGGIVKVGGCVRCGVLCMRHTRAQLRFASDTAARSREFARGLRPCCAPAVCCWQLHDRPRLPTDDW